MKQMLSLACALILYSSLQAQRGLDAAALAQAIQQIPVQAHSQQLDTDLRRKWWQSVLNACTVVGADVAGAIGGVHATGAVATTVGLATGGTGFVAVAGTAAVIGGAGASNGAYQSLHRTLPVTPGYGNLQITLPKTYSSLLATGRDHNEVLDQCYAKGRPLSVFYLPKLRAEQVALIESQLMQGYFQTLRSLGEEHIRQQGNPETLAAQLVANGMLPKSNAGAFMAFMQKMQVCGSPKDMENLINQSIRLIADSGIREIEKIALISGFLVASQSPFYTNPPL
jgi:hypothetical protein